MGQRLEDIRKSVHEHYLSWRNRDRIVQSELFQLAWEKDKDKLVTSLYVIDSSKLRRLIREIVFNNLEDCSLRILIELAKQKGVKNYSRLSKTQLIAELR